MLLKFNTKVLVILSPDIIKSKFVNEMHIIYDKDSNKLQTLSM